MEKYVRVNERIRVREIRLIGPEGEQLGIVSNTEGLKKARDAGLDLVEVAPQAVPPVCRIMDYSKYKYEQEKKEREARKKQHIFHIKEIKFKPNIEEHDYKTKFFAIEKFLKRGDKVKVVMVYRGREMAHTEIGRKVINRLIEDLAPLCEVERVPTQEGRLLIMIVAPKQ
ncbi:MAG: translation initiation factor IF-3 [Candidatus Omnitrophota bacterium]